MDKLKPGDYIKQLGNWMEPCMREDALYKVVYIGFDDGEGCDFYFETDTCNCEKDGITYDFGPEESQPVAKNHCGSFYFNYIKNNGDFQKVEVAELKNDTLKDGDVIQVVRSSGCCCTVNGEIVRAIDVKTTDRRNANYEFGMSAPGCCNDGVCGGWLYPDKVFFEKIEDHSEVPVPGDILKLVDGLGGCLKKGMEYEIVKSVNRNQYFDVMLKCGCEKHAKLGYGPWTFPDSFTFTLEKKRNSSGSMCPSHHCDGKHPSHLGSHCASKNCICLGISVLGAVL
jgi:hypothetical protein